MLVLAPVQVQVPVPVPVLALAQAQGQGQVRGRGEADCAFGVFSYGACHIQGVAALRKPACTG